ncbi:MAG: WD40/YVTN/BNR-like repeat-containing protein, partial [Nitrososphaera sp.]
MKFKVMGAMLSLLFCLRGEMEGATLHLSADHFSRTITARDTAYYWVEVFVEGNKAIAVNLSVLPDDALSVKFLKNRVNTPALVLLKVSAREQNHLGVHKLSIIASAIDADMAATLQVWLHVVKATVESPALVLDVSPSGLLDKNVPESLEGAIVPAKAGTAKVHLFSPSSKADTTLMAEVDKMGLFHVNHVFAEHGRWRAFTSFLAQGGNQEPNSQTIIFQVKRSPLRLTVAAEDSFRYQKNPKILRVLGQITPDYARGAKIKIRVTAPDSKQDSLTVLAESSNGKFSANFQAGRSGIYQIEAIADTAGVFTSSYGSLEEISRTALYASVTSSSFPFSWNFISSLPLPPPSGGGGNGNISFAPTDVPVGYAVIVVGDGPDYYSHLGLANILRAALIVRRGFRPQDILLRTLSINSPASAKLFFNVDFTEAALVTKIRDLLNRDHPDGSTPDLNFSTHEGLLFFWIGSSSRDGLNIVKFQAGQMDLDQNAVRTIYASALNGLGSYYNKGIVILHAGDNSGGLLEKIGLNNIPIGPIFAGTNGGGVFRSMDNGGNWMPRNISLINTNVRSLVINASGQVFAGTNGGGVCLSTNNGGSWTLAVNSNTGLTNTNVQALAINSSGDVFAGTAATTGGVFKLLNTGGNWTLVGQNSTGLTNTNVQALAINSSGHIFAGTNGGGAFLSTNNGGNWTAVNTNLTNLNVQA